jgi:1,4-dihydroxy-2-naphthoate octaprenyltransferase
MNENILNISNSKVALGTMRVPFLVLNPACVALGAAAAIFSGATINYVYLILALVGAITAHISVNALNEYSDFKSGLDLSTQRTPFSGGSGTLPKSPEKANIALITGVATLVITILIGIYFLHVWGLWILPLGLLGIIVIVVYTNWITKSPFLCLIAPGLGFGTLMVMGTAFVLTGKYSWVAFFAALVPFFLVSDLLLLNQFPDVEADKNVGRSHLPIKIGRKKSAILYTVFLGGAYLSVILGFILGILPALSLLALGTIIIAIPTAMGAFKYADDIEKLIPHMAKNVLINILTPALLAIGLILSA